CTAFNAQAAADGVRAAFHGENVLPLVNGTSAEGPAAAALVSPGVSSAHAAAPFPGDAVLSALGLAGLPGVDSRTYPLAAESQYPTTPHGEVGLPGLALSADSNATQSAAVAKGGG